MKITQILFWAVLLTMVVLRTSPVAGQQNYPTKAIRIITSPAGSSVDFVARLLAQAMTGPLGQAIVVENRPSGIAPGQAVAQAAPDGYTLVVSGSNLWIGQLLQSEPYDAVRDFSPISILVESPLILIVHPSVPAKSVKELIALAKAKPGELNFSSSALGTATHLAGSLFKAVADINIVNIPYKNAAQGITDIIGGQIHMTFDGGTLKPHIESGKLRALAITSAKPSALFPTLPTVAASGLPGYAWTSPLTSFAPAKTPIPIITRLNQEMVKVLSTPDARDKLFTVGIEPVGSSPEQLAAMVKASRATVGKIIKDAGIRVE